MTTLSFPASRRLARLAMPVLLAAAGTCATAGFAAEGSILHVFGQGRDGDNVYQNLVIDADGNLFGTAVFGGKSDLGIVFELSPPVAGQTAWTERVLHSFNGPDGQWPRSAMWQDASGALFGTTSEGGSTNGGEVFQLTPPTSPGAAWALASVHTFKGSADGAFPESMPVPLAGLAGSATAIRYGATVGGGKPNGGTVYALTPPATPGGAWAEKVIYTFDGAVGTGPTADLASDAAGNLYGVAFAGGKFQFGTVYRLSPPATAGAAWTPTLLHSFSGGADGRAPDQTLTVDATGALYGINSAGGNALEGNLFKMTPPALPGRPWKFDVLINFGDPAGGIAPSAALVPDGAGGFFGTTAQGGAQNCGTVFHAVPPTTTGGAWTETPIYSFTGGNGGSGPESGLILKDNVLYGSTYGATQADSVPCKGASVVFKVAL